MSCSASLTAMPWVCQPGTSAAHHHPCHYPWKRAGTGTPSDIPTSLPCSFGCSRGNLHIGLLMGGSPWRWRGQCCDSSTGARLGLQRVVAEAGEGSVYVPSPLRKPSLLSILSPSALSLLHDQHSGDRSASELGDSRRTCLSLGPMLLPSHLHTPLPCHVLSLSHRHPGSGTCPDSLVLSFAHSQLLPDTLIRALS